MARKIASCTKFYITVLYFTSKHTVSLYVQAPMEYSKPLPFALMPQQRDDLHSE